MSDTEKFDELPLPEGAEEVDVIGISTTLAGNIDHMYCEEKNKSGYIFKALHHSIEIEGQDPSIRHVQVAGFCCNFTQYSIDIPNVKNTDIVTYRLDKKVVMYNRQTYVDEIRHPEFAGFFHQKKFYILQLE
jgi:hypothetical protein